MSQATVLPPRTSPAGPRRGVLLTLIGLIAAWSVLVLANGVVVGTTTAGGAVDDRHPEVLWLNLVCGVILLTTAGIAAWAELHGNRARARQVLMVCVIAGVPLMFPALFALLALLFVPGTAPPGRS